MCFELLLTLSFLNVCAEIKKINWKHGKSTLSCLMFNAQAIHCLFATNNSFFFHFWLKISHRNSKPELAHPIKLDILIKALLGLLS